MQTYPVASGLYDPRFEHDSCGVSFVANMRGVASNELVRTGLSALCNLEHRGATGAEADTGDGAGAHELVGCHAAHVGDEGHAA